MKNIFGLVADFATKILCLPRLVNVQPLDVSRKLALLEHLREELRELQTASITSKQASITNDADALIDIMYICARGLFEMGFSPEQAQFAFEEVHRANMDKKPGVNSKRPESAKFDAVKPNGWKGPDWDMILSFDEFSTYLNEQAATQTAEQLVVSREELYGSFRERAEVVDVLTDAVESHPNWKQRLQANHRHAIRMILEKIGRVVVGGDPSYADNWKDIQGYAKLAEKDQ